MFLEDARVTTNTDAEPPRKQYHPLQSKAIRRAGDLNKEQLHLWLKCQEVCMKASRQAVRKELVTVMLWHSGPQQRQGSWWWAARSQLAQHLLVPSPLECFLGYLVLTKQEAASFKARLKYYVAVAASQLVRTMLCKKTWLVVGDTAGSLHPYENTFFSYINKMAACEKHPRADWCWWTGAHED